MFDKLISEEELKLAFEKRHGRELSRTFSNASVAVCGLGGLGSNIAVSLVRAGIGHLILIDFDKVDITNIHRQQYKVSQIGLKKVDALSDNLKEILPYVNLTKYSLKITEDNICSLLGDADIICEAFDEAEAKAMLVNKVFEKMPDKYVVAASGMAGIGSPNSIATRKISDKFYLCGDGISDVSSDCGLFAPRVMLCAAHQAHTVLRILAGKSDV